MSSPSCSSYLPRAHRDGRRRVALAAVAVSGAAFLVPPTEALALDCRGGAAGEVQLSTCFDHDNVWQRASGAPFLSVAPSGTLPAGGYGFAVSGALLLEPVRLRLVGSPLDRSLVVDTAVNGTLAAAFGVTDRLELTLAAPISYHQAGVGLLGVQSGPPASVARSTLHDLRLGASVALVQRPRTGPDAGLGVVARLESSVPMGNENTFAGVGTVMFAPGLALGYRASGFEVGLDLSARIRPEVRFGDETVGTHLTAAVGAAYDVLPSRLLTVGVEALAVGHLAEQRRADGMAGNPLVPVEWMGTVSSAPAFGGDFSVLAHAGSSVPVTGELGLTQPAFRGGLAIRFVTGGRDGDSDGVLDRADRCPTEREDRDGFQDDDGCPEPDNDGDGILDASDRCRDAAETVDGFQDDDGCPDNDDDGDGIPDESDACRNAAEDPDGYKDDDGCPEEDDDGDGVPDASDACRAAKEDVDGFLDTDGCPDTDNDRDGLADEADGCPDEAEDNDGFDDADGCPDPDNDRDGVPDAKDQCKTEAETLDGVKDDDGCPEPGAKSLVRVEGTRVVLSGRARFGAGSASVPDSLERELRAAAQALRGLGKVDFVVVEVFADRPGDSSPAATALADRRAAAVKAALVKAGWPSDVVAAAVGDAAEKRAANASPITITARLPSRTRKKK
jgi:OOP family OmpA-OmpF porin